MRLNSLVLYAIYFGIILAILKRTTRPLWFSLAVILMATLLYLVFPTAKKDPPPAKHDLQNVQNAKDEYCTPETGFCKVTPREWNVMNYNQNKGDQSKPYVVQPMNEMDAFYWDRTFYTLPVNTIPSDRQQAMDFIFASSKTNCKAGSIYRNYPACIAAEMVKNDVYARENDSCLQRQGGFQLVGN